jgi:hypothetical protein
MSAELCMDYASWTAEMRLLRTVHLRGSVQVDLSSYHRTPTADFYPKR